MIFLDEFSREYWMEFIAFRLGCCLFSSTWFVPDEYFQGIEVAYRMVFGQGHMAWEWSSKWALRSVLHPLLYALPFSALRFAGLDFAYLIRVTPQLLHAVLFATADMCYLKWLKKLGLSHKIFDLTISLYFSNWFLLYCCTRTLSNTVECALSLVALNWYEQGKRDKKPVSSSQPPGQSYGICIVCVAFATVIRPTAALLWATLLLLHFWENSRTADGRLSLRLMGIYIYKYAPYVLGIFFLAFSLDSLFYGRSIFCLWNFLRFNVLGGGNALFGVHPWHWYITQGLPPTLGIACIPLLTSMVNFRSFRIPKRYAGAACIYMIVHSVISHKEHRFILPVISFILPYVAFELSRYRYSRILKYLILIQNAALIIYFGLIHQRGPYAASNKLLGFIESQPKSVNITILQLMPCFSMPMIAALHPHAKRTRIKMLDCGLSLESINEKQKHASKQQETSTNTKIFGDEADEFHVNPIEWLNREWYAEQLYQNELIVAFEHTYSRIEHFLISKGYRRYASVFHTFFPISSRQSTNIVISYKANSLL